VPVLLEVGREHITGSALDDLLDEAASELIDEAMPELKAVGRPQGMLPL
jgi:ATP-dependent Lhr-like helicase